MFFGICPFLRIQACQLGAICMLGSWSHSVSGRAGGGMILCFAERCQHIRKVLQRTKTDAHTYLAICTSCTVSRLCSPPGQGRDMPLPSSPSGCGLPGSGMPRGTHKRCRGGTVQLQHRAGRAVEACKCCHPHRDAPSCRQQDECLQSIKKRYVLSCTAEQTVLTRVQAHRAPGTCPNAALCRQASKLLPPE